MAASDPIADMLAKVQNAAKAGHEKVDVPTSKMKLEIVKILKTEGYIKNFKKVQDENEHSIIRIFLKYDDANKAVIHGMKKIIGQEQTKYVMMQVVVYQQWHS